MNWHCNGMDHPLKIEEFGGAFAVQLLGADSRVIVVVDNTSSECATLKKDSIPIRKIQSRLWHPMIFCPTTISLVRNTKFKNSNNQ